MLFEFFGDILEKKFVPKYSCRMDDKRIVGKNYAPKVFKPDNSYFQIRLSEMFLRKKIAYGRGFIPLCVLLTDFLYAAAGKETHRQTFPFYASNQILGLNQWVGKEYVELYDTRVLGPVPYIGDDVGLFVGLFRSEVSNLAASLFKFAENIINAFDITRISTLLDIARPLSSGLADLLKLKEVEYLLGRRDDFSDTSKDDNQFRESYLVYVNCPENDPAAKDLWVQDGRLFTGPAKNKLKPFRDFDFCLIHIERLDTRNDYRTLPFYRLWQEAKGAIWEGNQNGAENKMLQLYRELAISPDLTKSHRYDLIRLFKVDFEQEKDFWLKTNSSSPAVKIFKGGTQFLSPRARIEKLGYLVEEIAAPPQVVKGLKALNTHWNKIIPERSEDLTEKELNEQLNTIAARSKIKDPDPIALADSLIEASLAMSLGSA